MTERTLGSRKRRRESDQAFPPHETSRHPFKKQKRHPSRPPPAFWDNLSEIPLEHRALKEHNRRLAQRLRLPSKIQPAGRSVRRDVLARFARHGGPDLSDLRGYRIRDSGMSSSQSSVGRRKRGSSSPSKKSTANTTTTKSTGPYDRAFQQHLIDSGIYPDGYEYPDGRIPPEPENMEEIRRVLAQTLSPALLDEHFRRFKRADANAVKERQVTTSVIPIIQGEVEDSKCVAGEIPFTNLDHLTDGSLVPGNPDLYYGARPEQLDQQVRAKLSGRIVPSTQKDLPILPNFFLAIKGPDGSAAVAKRQLLYDMCLGAVGFQSIRTYTAGKPVFDNKAYVIGYKYQDGQLKMYTCHPIRPVAARTRPQLVMTQIDSWSLTGNAETFRRGATAYRQAMAWAKEQRDTAIREANGKAATAESAPLDTPSMSFAGTSVDETAEHSSQRLTSSLADDSDISADELSLDHYRPPIKRPKMPPSHPLDEESKTRDR